MHVTMIGTGYVGLVSGACFADFGHTVTCIDKDASKIERLRAGGIPIYEPGLDVLVAKNVQAGRLFFDTDAAEAVKKADAVGVRARERHSGNTCRHGDRRHRASAKAVHQAGLDHCAQSASRARQHRSADLRRIECVDHGYLK